MWLIRDKDALLERAIFASFISETTITDNLVSYHEYSKLFERKFRQRRELIIESF